MKLTCAVVRDLLPLYAENLTEDETKKWVDEHLRDCAACRRRLAEADTEPVSTVETVRPMQALKKEIQKRRLFSAAAAALAVFVAVCTFFYHENRMEPVPWRQGLIEVEGIEARPYAQVFPEAAPDLSGSAADVLVLRVDGLINGTSEYVLTEDDGTRTVILQGWSTGQGRGSLVCEYNETVLFPVPDRLIYTGGGQQELLWGEKTDGGVELLPRLAPAYYVLLAAALALLSGLLWLIFRKKLWSGIIRQVFFAPVSYLIAHLLLMGTRTASFSLLRDLGYIALNACALYVLLTLLWQALLRRKRFP